MAQRKCSLRHGGGVKNCVIDREYHAIKLSCDYLIFHVWHRTMQCYKLSVDDDVSLPVSQRILGCALISVHFLGHTLATA